MKTKVANPAAPNRIAKVLAHIGNNPRPFFAQGFASFKLLAPFGIGTLKDNWKTFPLSPLFAEPFVPNIAATFLRSPAPLAPSFACVVTAA